MSKKKSLIVYGLSLVPIMLVVMYTLTRVLGKTEGYIIGYGIYLILLLMGIIWGWMMYKTHNIKIAILAHICVNLFAFSQLVYENWFI